MTDATQATTRRRSPKGGLMGLPEVLIVVVWVCLWMLWPPLQRIEGRPAKSSRRLVVVSYGQVRDQLYMSPTIFAQSAGTGFQPSEDLGKTLDRPVEAAPRRMRFLSLPPDPPAEIPRRRVPLGAQVASGMAGYQPAWRDAEVFPGRVAEAGRLIVEPSEPLKRNGFKVKGFQEPAAGWVRPWQAVVVVETGRDGGVEHTFLESGTGDADLDAMILRTLCRGAVTNAAVACMGRVTVSFGGRK